MLCPLFIAVNGCNINTGSLNIASHSKKIVNPIPAFIGTVPKPDGFKRITQAGGSFGGWIKNLPLRKDNVLRLYDSSIKKDQRLHYAILDVPYNRNALQQCADAVMRLYAEYIYETKALPAISFLHQHGKYFTCSSACSRNELEAFLKNVFTWCGTYNLSAQLKAKSFENIEAGDVLIKAGSPGHAMLVADVAENKKGEKIFLLLQSYMPAQEIHLVINPYHPDISPWYSASDSNFITPGWRFTRGDLKGWWKK